MKKIMQEKENLSESNQNKNINRYLEELKNKSFIEYLKLDEYVYIMINYKKVKLNDSIEKNSKIQSFQKIYNKFYNINAAKKDETWIKNYYTIFENSKNMFESSKEEYVTCFEDILNKISNKNKIDSSFASKLLATLNPNMPVWDKNVMFYMLENYNDEFKSYIGKHGNAIIVKGECYKCKIKNSVAAYKELMKKENELLEIYSETINDFQKYYNRKNFQEYFEKYYVKKYNKPYEKIELSKMKVLDFMLWKNIIPDRKI